MYVVGGLLGSTFAGRFRIERLLGSGGMGDVYLADHQLLRRPVALKLLHRELLADLKMMARFQREARAASRIVAPNVTSVFDFGHSEDGTPYLVMEYVEGRTLAAVVGSEGPFAAPRAARVLLQIAEGLAAAHEASVVHRDLKPSNVMLQDGDAVKILDFGLAKIFPDAGSMLSTVGSVLGTPGYMSPEQLVGGEAGPASDIYSFGLLALFVLTGLAPFEGDPLEVLRHQLESEPVSLGAIPDDTPAELRQLVHACLRRRPDDRPRDGRQLGVMLRPLGAGG